MKTTSALQRLFSLSTHLTVASHKNKRREKKMCAGHRVVVSRARHLGAGLIVCCMRCIPQIKGSVSGGTRSDPRGKAST